MIRIKETQATGLYLFQGRAAAGSVIIEDLVEARKLLSLLHKRLDGFVKIRDYLITEDCWSILCEVLTEEEVKAKFQSKLKTRTASESSTSAEVWRILSEEVRHILSMFVKFTNYRQGRTGSKVHSNYRRYIFENEEEGLAFIERMKRQAYRKSQKKRYRAKRGLCRITKREGKGHIYLCSMNAFVIGVGDLFGDGALGLIDSFIDVLREMVIHTKKLFQIENPKNAPHE